MITITKELAAYHTNKIHPTNLNDHNHLNQNTSFTAKRKQQTTTILTYNTNLIKLKKLDKNHPNNQQYQQPIVEANPRVLIVHLNKLLLCIPPMQMELIHSFLVPTIW